MSENSGLKEIQDQLQGNASSLTDPGKGFDEGCCESRRKSAQPQTAANEDARPVWDDATHKLAVHYGGVGLSGIKEQHADAKFFVDSFWGNANFKTALDQGLMDADYNAPWASNWWEGHFYHPVTRRNYNGVTVSAMTEGQRYFNLSVHVGRRIRKFLELNTPARDLYPLYARAGHYLGLSLHYLTDLTQPMHAANFPNIYGARSVDYTNMRWNDLRHSGFEAYAEKLVEGGYLEDSRVELRDVDTQNIAHAGQFLHEIAVNSEKVFRDLVSWPAAQKMKGGDSVYDNTWVEKEAKPALDQSLKRAPKDVARYLVYWTQCIRQDLNIDVSKWYRIKEFTRGEYLREYYGRVNRHKLETNDYELFFFFFHPDGSCSIGSKTNTELLWTMSTSGSDDPRFVHLKKEPGRLGPVSQRFRLVPTSDGRHWIYVGKTISTDGDERGDEAVSVSPYDDGNVLRWRPYGGAIQPYNEDGSFDKPTQLFKLEQAGGIGDNDAANIRRQWPQWPQTPWYGKPTVER